MMGKNREAFEAWCDSNFPFKKDRFQLFRGEYNSQFTRQLWQAWQASRQAIEVELPESKANVTYTNSGFNWGVGECAKALTSLGIRVKGNEE